MNEEELKKRTFVLLNVAINQIQYRDHWDAIPAISRVKNTLSGSIYGQYEGGQGYHKLLEEVKMIMYLTDISVEGMTQVLEDLSEHYNK